MNLRFRMTLAIATCLVAAPSVGAADERAAAPVTGTIVFEMPDGIHLIEADGTGLRKLPGTEPGDQDPRWSPDGRKIAFWHGTEADEAVFTVNPDGSGRRELGDGEYPVWSPDGTLLAFDTARDGDCWCVYVMKPDGTQARRVDTGTYAGWYPSWTPSGEVSFDAGKIDGSGGEYYARNGIMAVGIDGTALRRVTTLRDDDWWSSWSPDGATIAFTTTVRKKAQIGVVGADGAPTVITQNRWTDEAPRWTPDGLHILFTSERNGLGEIYVMDADGSHQRRITRIPNAYAWGGDLQPSAS